MNDSISQIDIDYHTKIINNLSQIECAKLHRFAPSGHMYFDSTLPLYKVFNARFESLGGMTPEISKAIGWIPPHVIY